MNGMSKKTTERLELIAQCTAYLVSIPESTAVNAIEHKQVELIRESLLEIVTEHNYRRLSRNLIDLASKLGDIRYSYSQEFWRRYLEIWG